MSKLPKTRYASTDPEAVELGWKLKRVNETHAMHQRALVDEYRAKSEAMVDEYRAKSEALTDASQAEQSEVFEAIARKVGLEAKDYGDGKDWALNIERIAEGEVALVHASDEARADDCQCPICQLRRSLAGTRDLEEAPVVH